MILLSSLRLLHVLDITRSRMDSRYAWGWGQYGYTIFFEATWVHASKPRRRVTRPQGWSADSAAALDAWSAAHDYVGILTAGVDLPEMSMFWPGSTTGR